MMSWGVMGGQLLSGWGMVEEGWRKGPWTAEEDRLLIEYVRLHGEGRWNSVARLAGLKRNGKSCRLRWVNYLRPDLKRGQITPHEESIILELHARWGNRWSTIARSLPGRTDNEIKNYWRTHFKKKTKSSTDNSEKTRNRLLRRQLFRKQQQQQQQQLQFQLQLQQQQEQQQQQQQVLQFNQLDMKKIMSLLEDDGYNSSSSSSSDNNGEAYVPHQLAPTTATTTSAYNPTMTEEHYHQLCNSYFPEVHPMTTPEAASTNEDNVLWDGLWNLDVEGHGNFGFAAATAGCFATRNASFQNLVTPYC